VSSASEDPRAWSRTALAAVEARLGRVFADVPGRLGEACRYPLRTGGKRMRPLFVLAAAEAVAGTPGWGIPGALDAAAALELVHTYSLVHDDLPCMDDDDLRRGLPTVHRAYGEDAAVLVGDALLTEAFVVAAAVPDIGAALVRALGEAAGARGMIGGQAADIGMTGAIADVDALLALHRGKTGALLRAALKMGGFAAGADADTLATLDRCGDAVGLAFQIHDDWLDAEQDEGKGDDGPPSFVALVGRGGTVALAARWRDEALAAAAALPAPAALDALIRFTVARDH
jgi:geranylgeranyl pyrophosphate synthase